VTTVTAGSLDRGERSLRQVGLLVGGGSVLAGLVAGHLIESGHAAAVAAIALVLLPVFLWRKPQHGPVVLLVAALLVEQFGYTVGPRAGAATAQIPLFQGIGPLHINPADLLLCLLFAMYVARHGLESTRPLPRTAIAKCLYALLGVVILGVVVGKLHGGQIRFAFTETRPYAYLVATFVLASVLLTTRAAVRALLWAFVAAIGFKAGQGLLIFLSVRHLAARPEAVLAHEEALFFALFLLLALALWLFEVEGMLRTVATALVPVVVAADLANTRRAAWLVLGTGLVVLLTVTYVAVPERRRTVGRIMLALAVGLAFYLPAYWNKSGGLAQPARAIHSTISPSPRDASSDLYRIQEDANLHLNIRQAGPLGKGFGVPIDYALPIQDISSIDPFIAYIPHNGVLYVLMRMGVLGGIVFWSLLGIGIVGACRLAKSRDREAGVIGALTAAVLVAYAFEGATDQGFFYYRVAFVIGTLLGLVEAARRLEMATDSSPLPPRVRLAPVPQSVPTVAAQAAEREVVVRWRFRELLPALGRSPRPCASGSVRVEGDYRWALVARGVLLAALGLLTWLWVGQPNGTTGRPIATWPVWRSPMATSPSSKAANQATESRTEARIALVGVGAGSWVEIRRGSRHGRIVYSGVLNRGRRAVVSGTRIWAQLDDASNLTITLNGKPVRLRGRGALLFTRAGVRLD
jgi:RodZ C-terminal domain